MAVSLIRFDLSLPCYFTYAPAPGVTTRPQIPRREPKGLYMRGETGEKHDGSPRLMTAHNTTHLDVPYHFYEHGADLAAVLNRRDQAADRPVLARLVVLAGRGDLPGAYSRGGVTYCEAVSAALLPTVEELREYEALVVLTGFGQVMAAQRQGQFQRNSDGFYHVPYLTDDAVERILEAELRVVGIDSTTVERQLSAEPHRMASDAHFRLLGHEPPVLILEGLNGTGLEAKVGFLPLEGLLHIVPRRVNAEGADAAHSRAFLYFYRGDEDGRLLRQLKEAITPHEFYG
jgi:kynurenine formamidase